MTSISSTRSTPESRTSHPYAPGGCARTYLPTDLATVLKSPTRYEHVLCTVPTGVAGAASCRPEIACPLGAHWYFASPLPTQSSFSPPPSRFLPGSQKPSLIFQCPFFPSNNNFLRSLLSLISFSPPFTDFQQQRLRGLHDDDAHSPIFHRSQCRHVPFHPRPRAPRHSAPVGGLLDLGRA